MVLFVRPITARRLLPAFVTLRRYHYHLSVVTLSGGWPEPFHHRRRFARVRVRITRDCQAARLPLLSFLPVTSPIVRRSLHFLLTIPDFLLSRLQRAAYLISVSQRKLNRGCYEQRSPFFDNHGKKAPHLLRVQNSHYKHHGRHRTTLANNNCCCRMAHVPAFLANARFLLPSS